jgi:hypothetical protein
MNRFTILNREQLIALACDGKPCEGNKSARKASKRTGGEAGWCVGGRDSGSAGMDLR